MRLWLLRPRDEVRSRYDDNPWDPWFNKTFGFVIRAETEARARQLANEEVGGPLSGPHDVWTNAAYVSCAELLSDGLEEVIIEDFHAA